MINHGSELITLFEHKNTDPNIVWAPEYKIIGKDGKIWGHGHFYDEEGERFNFTVYSDEIYTMVIHWEFFDDVKDMYMSSIHFKMLADLIDTISAKMKELMLK